MGGQLVIGNLFGLLTQMCIPGPEDVGVDLLLVADLLAPLATAIGKYTMTMKMTPIYQWVFIEKNQKLHMIIKNGSVFH